MKHASARRFKTRTTVAFVGVSVVTFGYIYLYENDDDYLVDEFPRRLPVTMYRILPLNEFSRLFGIMARKEIPEILRGVLLGSYVKLTGCDLSEAKFTDVREYKSFSDLFRRQLKWDSRHIDRNSDIVSPCDGTVLYCGQTVNGTMEQVKGVKFTLKGFLGKDLQLWKDKFIDQEKETSNESNKLHFCTIYLAPGDYHRFHSPTECDLVFRRYFFGKLLSVNPWLAKFIPGLFSVNERVVYFSKWKHGLMTFTAVGATNVGNIRVFSDPELPSNEDNHSIKTIIRNFDQKEPLILDKNLSPLIRLSRGQLFGEFNLGSTIVLIFEAPPDFKFCVGAGHKLKMGMPLGCCGESVSKVNTCKQM